MGGISEDVKRQKCGIFTLYSFQLQYYAKLPVFLSTTLHNRFKPLTLLFCTLLVNLQLAH